jgi:hypothetical protein
MCFQRQHTSNHHPIPSLGIHTCVCSTDHTVPWGACRGHQAESHSEIASCNLQEWRQLYTCRSERLRRRRGGEALRHVRDSSPAVTLTKQIPRFQREWQLGRVVLEHRQNSWNKRKTRGVRCNVRGYQKTPSGDGQPSNISRAEARYIASSVTLLVFDIVFLLGSHGSDMKSKEATPTGIMSSVLNQEI